VADGRVKYVRLQAEQKDGRCEAGRWECLTGDRATRLSCLRRVVAVRDVMESSSRNDGDRVGKKTKL
jgi:hypothetical protein